jgi:hypothetical protein
MLKGLFLIGGVFLAMCAVALAVHVWQTTPFFDLTLVFVDVVMVLLTATSLSIAMLSRTD